MATSRPIRVGEWLTHLSGPHIGGNYTAKGDEHTPNFVLQADFGLDMLCGDEYRSRVCTRVFGLHPSATNASLTAAITNGTAPGLYVREGDDTSNWEVYRGVLARRVEEAMAARRGGESGVDETATVTATATATRRDDEIRVGDVVEVVSYDGFNTIKADIGRGGRVSHLAHGVVYLNSIDGMRLPVDNVASLADVRKVSSPPQTVAVTVSPMSDGEAARIEAAVTDEARRSVSSPLASSSDETTTRRVVNPVPPAVSVSLRPRDFNAATITDYLQSLGATHIHLRQSPGNPPVVEVTGLSRQAFNTACQNLPVGVQLRAVGGFLGQRDSGETTTSPTSSSAGITRGAQSEPPTLPPQSQQPTQQPSRFSLLEVDADPSTADASPSPPQVPKASTGLAALQQELRAEREAKRALAAAQMPPGRFDLLECDLPAAPAPAAAKPVKSPQSPRPVVSSSPPPRPRNPVETITDLTAARSPLELARMLEGLNDELSTMMRQREAN